MYQTHDFGIATLWARHSQDLLDECVTSTGTQRTLPLGLSVLCDHLGITVSLTVLSVCTGLFKALARTKS